ncbi:MAG TPA: Uma2 family endonuclease [Thermoanaerobaculia bacterium]|nr:Uma2 family endonuclease [Thermoanaerobaculia bacterium]
MAIAQLKPRLTPAEYLATEREADTRSEYIEGEMYAMSGASYAHNVIVTNLAAGLHAALRGGPCRAIVSDMRVKDATSELYTYPDVVVVCGKPRFEEPAYLDTLTNPTLVIEVLSPSTERHDRGLKFAYYRSIPSLREVLFVAQDRPIVERYTRGEGDDWLLHVVQGLDAAIELPGVGARLVLAEIYEGALGETGGE